MPTERLHSDKVLNFVCEPGAIEIEAVGDAEQAPTASPGCRGSRWSPTPAGRCGSPAGAIR